MYIHILGTLFGGDVCRRRLGAHQETGAATTFNGRQATRKASGDSGRCAASGKEDGEDGRKGVRVVLGTCRYLEIR